MNSILAIKLLGTYIRIGASSLASHNSIVFLSAPPRDIRVCVIDTVFINIFKITPDNQSCASRRKPINYQKRRCSEIDLLLLVLKSSSWPSHRRHIRTTLALLEVRCSNLILHKGFIWENLTDYHPSRRHLVADVLRWKEKNPLGTCYTKLPCWAIHPELTAAAAGEDEGHEATRPGSVVSAAPPSFSAKQHAEIARAPSTPVLLVRSSLWQQLAINVCVFLECMTYLFWLVCWIRLLFPQRIVTKYLIYDIIVGCLLWPSDGCQKILEAIGFPAKSVKKWRYWWSRVKKPPHQTIGWIMLL